MIFSCQIYCNEPYIIQYYIHNIAKKSWEPHNWTWWQKLGNPKIHNKRRVGYFSATISKCCLSCYAIHFIQYYQSWWIKCHFIRRSYMFVTNYKRIARNYVHGNCITDSNDSVFSESEICLEKAHFPSLLWCQQHPSCLFTRLLLFTFRYL